MKKVEIEIEGITPLLMNRFTEENEVKVSSGTSISLNSGDKGTPREQATKKAYRSERDGQLYIPAMNLFRAVIDAGIFHKAGKSTKNRRSDGS